MATLEVHLQDSYSSIPQNMGIKERSNIGTSLFSFLFLFCIVFLLNFFS